MVCPKCGSEYVSIEMIPEGGKVTKQGIGLGGRINNKARKKAAFLTLGMSNLVWKKTTGTEKSKTKMSKVALCQNCGYDWKV